MDIVAFRSHENNILETFLVAEIKSSVKKKRRSCPEIGRPHSHLKVVTFFSETIFISIVTRYLFVFSFRRTYLFYFIYLNILYHIYTVATRIECGGGI